MSDAPMIPASEFRAQLPPSVLQQMRTLLRAGLLIEQIGAFSEEFGEVWIHLIKTMEKRCSAEEKAILAEEGQAWAVLRLKRGDPAVATQTAVYSRYGDTLNWRTLQALPMATYDKLPPDHLRGWAAVVEEVKAQIRQSATLPTEDEK